MATNMLSTISRTLQGVIRTQEVPSLFRVINPYVVRSSFKTCRKASLPRATINTLSVSRTSACDSPVCRSGTLPGSSDKHRELSAQWHDDCLGTETRLRSRAETCWYKNNIMAPTCVTKNTDQRIWWFSSCLLAKQPSPRFEKQRKLNICSKVQWVAINDISPASEVQQDPISLVLRRVHWINELKRFPKSHRQKGWQKIEKTADKTVRVL